MVVTDDRKLIYCMQKVRIPPRNYAAACVFGTGESQHAPQNVWEEAALGKEEADLLSGDHFERLGIFVHL